MSIPSTLSELKQSAIERMRNYQESVNGPSSSMVRYVGKCDVLLETFLQRLVEAKGDTPAIMAAAETAVLAINALNDRADGGLIETGEREDLCELIDQACAWAGLDIGEGDVAGNWREW
ncbi:hypothetical protein [Tahibacter amnicola]|uniref:Uncharacterized protein n=1 Tax=Tahibacter amnicola TaxID=2976241 RepID=A0ABY6BIF4_9GAMM|nr:hypothetical protein [Tahibacter amnicola]UXI69784.1 hypothetical protein N4264_09185 [Tahibacter amnicola]